MDGWAKAAPRDREALFIETANAKGISPEIVEKDFWVCWTLRHIFLLQELPRIIFKGGTSLSKAFGIIKRFSEDIDLVINRHEIGFNDKNDPANQEQTNLRNRTIETLKATCVDVIEKEFLVKLKAEFQSVIGDQGWNLLLDPMAPDRDTLEFTYPKGIPGSLTLGYIKRVVRLELGCRGDQVPFEEVFVTPYAAEVFPSQFTIPSAKVNVISVERTFWEKVTILHREYYRVQNGKAVGQRVFRHYHDVVVIAKHARGKAAIEDSDLLAQVVAHKQHFFREAAAQYELAKRGTLRLVPHAKLEEELRKDHAGMREMFFGNHPDFDEVMDQLRKLESELNKT